MVALARFWEYLQRYFVRHETEVDNIANIKAGIAAIVGMMAVGGLATLTDLPLLIAPLGATAVLLFGQPSSPLAQPFNIMGGFLVGTIVCETTQYILPMSWTAVAAAVGVAIVLMRAFRVTHPPAGAMPLLGFDSTIPHGKLFVTVLIASVILIGLAAIIHAVPPKRRYPL